MSLLEATKLRAAMETWIANQQKTLVESIKDGHSRIDRLEEQIQGVEYWLNVHEEQLRIFREMALREGFGEEFGGGTQSSLAMTNASV